MRQFFRLFFTSSFCLLVCVCAPAQSTKNFTHADSLRGSNGPGRNSWNLLKYELTVKPNYSEKSIEGKNIITFLDHGTGDMQIDLQEPMFLDSVVGNERKYGYRREGNVFWISLNSVKKIQGKQDEIKSLSFYFHGKPTEAVNPPWDGGWIWKKDDNGNPWMTVACQGIGASVWFPCKDTQSDEPDSGAIQHIIVPDSLEAIGNGQMTGKRAMENGLQETTWQVLNPINNYCIVPYIGKYTHFGEKINGEKGPLMADYWVMDYNLEKAKHQFTQVPEMIKIFEHWFGPYPFYEDGYKLVEAPMLGMEHQSAIAYGNGYRNGYNNDRRSFYSWSGTKWEQMFDYIIIHESGHEWFGNSITSNDIADMWVHESFTSYSEVLYVESKFGKQATEDYLLGTRRVIKNAAPMISPYGVNADHDIDIYFKGASLIHMIRSLVADDALFREILIGLNARFYHRTVDSRQVEDFISSTSKKPLSKVFDQYLRTNKLPILVFETGGKKVSYKWENVVPGFNMPVRVDLGHGYKWLSPSTTWKQTKPGKNYDGQTFTVDKDFYILSKRVNEK